MTRTALAAALALGLSVNAAAAQEATTYPFDGTFDEATMAVEAAIIGKGLVIDYRSHVGEMLNRTAADVGSTVKVYDNADVFLFCSAVLSRKMMEADPLNIAHCPYGVFVMDRAGQVSVGYRQMPEGPMQQVQTLLDEIAREAAGQ